MDRVRPPLKLTRPRTRDIRVSDRTQIDDGQRGSVVSWCPHSAVLTQSLAQTAAKALSTITVPVPVPQNAVAIMAIVHIASNTVVANSLATFFAYPTFNVGGGILKAVAVVTKEMSTNNGSMQIQAMLPMDRGAITYEVTVAGTVNYDLKIFLVGFVLA